MTKKEYRGSLSEMNELLRQQMNLSKQDIEKDKKKIKIKKYKSKEQK
jgi:hypothetical protein